MSPIFDTCVLLTLRSTSARSAVLLAQWHLCTWRYNSTPISFDSGEFFKSPVTGRGTREYQAERTERRRNTSHRTNIHY